MHHYASYVIIMHVQLMITPADLLAKVLVKACYQCSEELSWLSTALDSILD